MFRVEKKSDSACQKESVFIMLMKPFQLRRLTNNSIHKPPAVENLKGSTGTARAYLMGANLIDGGGL